MLFNCPTAIYIDASSNIYVDDAFNFRVMLWHNNSSAGTGSRGTTLSTLNEVVGLNVDTQGNIYLCRKWNNWVTKWAPNAVNGVLRADCNTNQLNSPFGLFLDESHWHLYIVDGINHRIQRITLNNSLNTTIVACGNGAGSGNNQLSYPLGVCVSK
jgi:hypothetical protein